VFLFAFLLNYVPQSADVQTLILVTFNLGTCAICVMSFQVFFFSHKVAFDKCFVCVRLR